VIFFSILLGYLSGSVSFTNKLSNICNLSTYLHCKGDTITLQNMSHTEKQILKDFPTLSVGPLTDDIEKKYKLLIQESGIKYFGPDVEVWTSEASNKALSYSSHGIFRYFGKFPPPIARYLIETFTQTGDLVIDPMCGSGTTGLEALLLGRRAKCFDVSPLATLVSRVKITPINRKEAENAIKQVRKFVEFPKKNQKPELIGLRNSSHWFLEETMDSLELIRLAIKQVKTRSSVRDFLNVAFLGVVRRVSRATTQQGRLFLDVETAEKDASPFFFKKAGEILDSVTLLPKGEVNVLQRSILGTNTEREKTPLVICHPPYFNSYKYSGVNSLELAWMNIDHANIRKNEIRESFKVGKPEKVEEYVEDMRAGLENLSNLLQKNGHLALMIGDTVIRGKYIPVTRMLLARLQSTYKIERAVVRIPKFTEASWAASQRRKGKEVGINLCDLIVVLKKQ